MYKNVYFYLKAPFIFFLFLASRVIRSITAAKYREKQQVERCAEAEKERTKDYSSPWSHCRCFCYPAEEKPVEIQWVKPEPKSRFESQKEKDLQKTKKMKQKMSSGNVQNESLRTNLISVVLYLFCVQCVNTLYLQRFTSIIALKRKSLRFCDFAPVWSVFSK